MVEPIKLVVGLPSTGMMQTETAKNLVFMLTGSSVPLVFDIATPTSCYVHINREKCVDHARNMKADYLLFVDTDMLFPPDALDRLLALKVDIASVTYNKRCHPRCSVVKLVPEYDSEYAVDDSVTERPIPLEAITHPFRCGGAGTGFMLIKMSVFDRIPRPWFFFTPEMETPEGKIEATGEDIFFYGRARDHGFDIWIDPTIRVGHIGSAIF